MKAGYTDITFILDRSSSMEPMRDEAIDGFNKFVEDQIKEPGTAYLTLILFDTEVKFPFRGNLSEIPQLNRDTYVPRGLTALYDAVGEAIDKNGARFAAMDEAERPEKVIVGILTDGHENSSLHYSHSKIAEMIKHQQDEYSWVFIFLGANMDSKAVAYAINIPMHNAIDWENTPVGATVANTTFSRMTSGLRNQ